MNSNDFKSGPWKQGAVARLQQLDRDANPYKFYGETNPQGNIPWSEWNHGWSWSDAQLMLLMKRAERGDPEGKNG